MSAYLEDVDVSTVLIEGSVSIYKENEAYDENSDLILKPGFKVSLNKNDDIVSVNEVDTSVYTSWRDDKLVFKNMQFKKIIKKLERHYNVVIVNNK